MNTAEMTTERDRCKAAALANAAQITPAMRDWQRDPLVLQILAYADCVDALNVGIAGGANATRDPLLDAAKATLADYEQRFTGNQFIAAHHLDQVRAYARAAKLA